MRLSWLPASMNSRDVARYISQINTLSDLLPEQLMRDTREDGQMESRKVSISWAISST